MALLALHQVQRRRIALLQLMIGEFAGNDPVLNPQDNDQPQENQVRHWAPRLPNPRANLLLPGDFELYFNNWTDLASRLQFRLTRNEIFQLKEALKLPDVIKTEERDRVSGVEALCMVLYRLSSPVKLDRMQFVFGRHISACSRIILTTIEWIVTRWSELLTWDPHRLTCEKLTQFAAACGSRPHTSDRVFGFIDGTVRRICRPTRNQETMYNGHKGYHALKYQVLVTPDGIIIHISEPEAGIFHDQNIFNRSVLRDLLDQYAWDDDGQPLAIYGDSAYHLDLHVLRPFVQREGIPLAERRFNTAMSKERASVEMALGNVLNLFQSLDFYRNMMLLKSPIGLFFQVSVLFTNAICCLRGGNNITTRYDLVPPHLLQYFNPQLFRDIIQEINE